MSKIVLNGSNLTTEILNDIVYNSVEIEIDKNTMKRLEDARQLVFDLVDADFPIYGFNVGVGWNKDKKVFKEFFQQYNENLIKSHCIGVPPYASIADARSAMLARLNTMLVGCTGVGVDIPVGIMKMLNAGITPLIPERGSVGQGDIGLLSHIGLALIGEGEVYYNNEVRKSSEVFEELGMQPVVLGPKDGLAIVSSNAFAAGIASLAIEEVNEFLEMANLVFSLSLEGFNGSPAPLDGRVHELRRYSGQKEVAAQVRKYIEGSFVYTFDPDKMVHDPLCYRNYAYIHGAVQEMIEYTTERLNTQLNVTEDNPCVLLEEKTIIPAANFEPLNWLLGIESIAISLSHVSQAMCNRIVKMANPEFTKLPRFLSPDVTVLGFATLQKAFTALDVEIRNLCMPSSMDTLSLAGDMEDRSTNGPYVIQKLRKITDNLKYILAFELYHAAQAMDYRKGRTMGKATKELFDLVRLEVPFYDKDRNITADIETIYKLINSDKILNITKKYK